MSGSFNVGPFKVGPVTLAPLQVGPSFWVSFARAFFLRQAPCIVALLKADLFKDGLILKLAPL